MMETNIYNVRNIYIESEVRGQVSKFISKNIIGDRIIINNETGKKTRNNIRRFTIVTYNVIEGKTCETTLSTISSLPQYFLLLIHSI